MASLLSRTVTRLAGRTSVLSTIRSSSTQSQEPAVDPHKGKVVMEGRDMPDGLGHAVGPERFELLARAAGNDDPFEMNVRKRAKGTVKEPTLIPSAYNTRLVGCVCEEEALIINWMYLHSGEPKRCQCGYWFKLTPLEKVDYGQ